METAVRTTGLVSSRRNRGGRTDPFWELLTIEATTLLSKGSYPRPLECGLSLYLELVFFYHCRSRGAQRSYRYQWIPTERHADRPKESAYGCTHGHPLSHLALLSRLGRDHPSHGAGRHGLPDPAQRELRPVRSAPILERRLVLQRRIVW